MRNLPVNGWCSRAHVFSSRRRARKWLCRNLPARCGTAPRRRASKEIMMTKRQSDASILAKPPITLTAADYDRLSGLASAAMHNMPEVAITLADELDRAHVLKTGRHPL